MVINKLTAWFAINKTLDLCGRWHERVNRVGRRMKVVRSGQSTASGTAKCCALGRRSFTTVSLLMALSFAEHSLPRLRRFGVCRRSGPFGR
jgi:hypothetical protein